MEKFINEIIELDNDTLKLNEEFTKKIINSENELKESFKKIEEENYIKTKNIIESETKKILDEGNLQVNSIRKNYEDQVANMNKVFSQRRDSIVNNFFNQIVKEGQ